MKRATIALAVLLASTAAHADSFACYRFGGSFSCTWGPTQSQRVIHVAEPQTDAERAERKARADKWESFCKPMPVVDKYGVSRMQYAHEGCDVGRSE